MISLSRVVADSLQWAPEVKHHAKNVPFLLIGTKVDLRNEVWPHNELANGDQVPITFAQGLEMARTVGAVK
jgi:GTPase SAR1 family protein